MRPQPPSPLPLPPIEQEVQVRFTYPVVFTRGLFDPANPTLADALARDGGTRPRRVLVVVDAGVADAHPALLDVVGAYAAAHAGVLQLAGPPVVVPGGEAVKHDPAHVDAILEAVDERGIDRHSYIAVIGGGAVLDMAGYAAAIAHRGVRLVRIPTTVLSQNDSAVGVKNSVNAFGKKNFLGTFAPPVAVLNDLDFLSTLEDRDWCGGLSEAVKVALLKDAAFFDWLEANAAALRDRDAEAMAYAVYRCAQLHLQHIATSGDPFELGSSRPLDFGHWAAHKLEALTGYAVRHGEAVGVGLALDVTYAHLSGLIPAADGERVVALLEALGIPTAHAALLQEDAEGHRLVLDGLREFREHLGGELTVMLLEGIGRGIEVHTMDEALVLEAAAVLLDTTTEEETAWTTVPSAAR